MLVDSSSSLVRKTTNEWAKENGGAENPFGNGRLKLPAQLDEGWKLTSCWGIELGPKVQVELNKCRENLAMINWMKKISLKNALFIC